MDARKTQFGINLAQNERDQARALYAADFDMARARHAADKSRKTEESEALNRIQLSPGKKTQSGWWDEEVAQPASQ